MAVSNPPGEVVRRRRAHKKSRRGCTGCKLRRVKCTEEMPACRKCKAFGIACVYGGKASGLKFMGEGSFSLNGKPEKPVPGEGVISFGDEARDTSSSDGGVEDDGTLEVAARPLPPHEELHDVLVQKLTTPGSVSSLECAWMAGYRGSRADWDLMKKFRDRTILTVGHKQASLIYQREVVGLSFSRPFLSHIVLTLASIHDRYIKGLHGLDATTAWHWCIGTTLFKEALPQPASSATKDALWASAALLAAIQFASIEATRPEEAWPMKPYDARDLDWLKMSDGKKAVWKITDPTRPDSVFSQFSRGHITMFRPMCYSRKELVNVHRDFSDLFNLGPDSSGDANPYHQAALSLARLLATECNQATILEFFSFIGHVHPELKNLLDLKDPKALLLVACWYAKIHGYQWWINRRGLLEGKAICMYLDKYHFDDVRIQRLLEWPKAAFGMPRGDAVGQFPDGSSCPSSAAVLSVL